MAFPSRSFTRNHLRRLTTQIGVRTTLHNREQRLAVSIVPLGGIETVNASAEPAVGHFHRLPGVARTRMDKAYIHRRP